MTINSKTLLSSLNRLKPCFTANRIIPQLENFIITGNKIWGTDTITTIIDTLPTEYAQPVMLPFEEMLRICNVVEGDLTIEEKKQSLTVHSSEGKWSLGKAEAIENFPAMPEYPERTEQMPDGFFDCLADAAKCVLDDPYDFKRNVCIDFKDNNVFICGANGAIYYFAKFQQQHEDKQYTVTTDFIKSLSGVTTGSISFTDKFSYCATEKTVIISRLPDIKYVDFHPFLTVSEINITCLKADLIAALNKCFVYKLINYYIEFVSSATGFDISLNDRDFEKSAVSELKAEHSIKGSFFLNAKQLQLVLSVLPGEIVHLSFMAPDKSLYFTHENVTIILQPIKY